MTPWTPEAPIVRVGDDEALVFTMRDLNQQTAPLIKELEKVGKPAIITRHGRFIATVTPLGPGQVESRILPEMARHVAKQLPASPEAPIVRVGDDEALVFTMRDLNQHTGQVMEKIEKAGEPAIITRHGRFIAIIRPLAPGQVESRVLPEVARQVANRDQG